jgi:integrase
VPAHTHLNDICTPNEILEFETLVLFQKLSRSTPGKTFDQTKSYWAKAKKILGQVNAQPKEYSYYSNLIYQAAETEKIHPTYFVKILKLVNEWGSFIAMKRGYSYAAVKAPRGFAKQRMLEASGSSNRTKKPISAELLEGAKPKMREEHYSFLYICFWFGLRPSELERCLKQPETFRLVELEGQRFLDIYQGKLGQLERSDRWKLIPIVEVEQVEAARLLSSGAFKRPDYRTVKKYLGSDAGLYSPRKSFAKTMIGRGWEFSAASKFLGHQSIKTTESYYIDRMALQTSNALLAVKARLAK